MMMMVFYNAGQMVRVGLIKNNYGLILNSKTDPSLKTKKVNN